LTHHREYVPKTVQLGRLLRERRLALGVTQRDVAERIEMYQTAISKLECGSYGLPSLPILARLADALEAPLAALIEAAGYRLD
jgi:transcriptional regulator with XRE-family HTH domain